jgi:hypothetical protein
MKRSIDSSSRSTRSSTAGIVMIFLPEKLLVGSIEAKLPHWPSDARQGRMLAIFGISKV